MSENTDNLNLPRELTLDVDDIFEDNCQVEAWVIDAIKNPEWIVEANNKRVKQDWNNLKKQYPENTLRCYPHLVKQPNKRFQDVSFL